MATGVTLFWGGPLATSPPSPGREGPSEGLMLPKG